MEIYGQDFTEGEFRQYGGESYTDEQLVAFAKTVIWNFSPWHTAEEAAQAVHRAGDFHLGWGR